MAGNYAASSQALLARGRHAVDRMLAGDMASVYAERAPELKAEVSLAQAEQTLAEAQADAPIGPRQEERVIPLGGTQGVYFRRPCQRRRAGPFPAPLRPGGAEPGHPAVRPLPPDPRAGHPARARLRLPFEGLWWAGQAPSPEIGNHHAVVSDQRHAFDFAIWRDGSTHRGDGTDNADYWAWGQPVRAPGRGTVVAVQDGVADNRPRVETNPRQPAGNSVVLDLGHGEYAVLAHFQKGSARVAKGDQVTAGQVLGLTGNSGSSDEPHIYFHVQDSPELDPGGPTGVPVEFESYEADGAAQARGTPTGGQFVRPLAQGASGG